MKHIILLSAILSQTYMSKVFGETDAGFFEKNLNHNGVSYSYLLEVEPHENLNNYSSKIKISFDPWIILGEENSENAITCEYKNNRFSNKSGFNSTDFRYLTMRYNGELFPVDFPLEKYVLSSNMCDKLMSSSINRINEINFNRY